MARDERHNHENENAEEIERTIDPYTGDLVPVSEDADQFIEVMPEETDDRRGSNYILNEETGMDNYAANADADAVARQAAHYTDDEEIEEDFAQRQRLAVGGRDALLEELEEHNSLSPRLSGGDIDAAWQDANVAGEEAIGGSVITPDQDVVDELGEGAGLTYDDNEPLDYDKKVLNRDRDRWELNPASANDPDDELEDQLDDEEDDELEDDEDMDELEDEGEDEDEDNDEDIEALDGLAEEEEFDKLDDEAEDDEDDILDAEFDDREDEDG